MVRTGAATETFQIPTKSEKKILRKDKHKNPCYKHYNISIAQQN